MQEVWSEKTKITFGSFKLSMIDTLPSKDWNATIKKTEKTLLELEKNVAENKNDFENNLINSLMSKIKEFLNLCSYRSSGQMRDCEHLFTKIDNFFLDHII
ncbi:MAG: hypothetical protein PF572_02715 [Patescibacteria group bacterium]|jgi:hypothetical protein|nr:hypothetical protein [Patescibacteria group bacterium]